jgi:hypothetical protein
MLGPLANNGDSTLTHALLTGSPAIDAGNAGGCTDNLGAMLPTDQRGFHCPIGPHCDIGAVEYSSYALRAACRPFISRIYWKSILRTQ